GPFGTREAHPGLSSKRRVAITGTTGQLGRALVAAQCDEWELLQLNRQDTDLLNWQLVRERIMEFAPDLVIHCGAATDVDGCERDPEMAYLGNAVATRGVAQAAAAADAQLVYVSTNF